MLIEPLKHFLEKLDRQRDEFLFVFIKPFWPRRITPNMITYVRAVTGMLLFILLFFFGIVDKPLIMSLFCLGVVSDLFDGSVARGLNKVTEFGAMLDPVADRILILPIAVYSLYGSHRWLLFFLLLAEILSALVSLFHKSKESYVAANIFGKTKMVLVSIVFIVILFDWPNEPAIFFIDVLWLSLIFSILNIFVRISELKQKGYIKNRLVNTHINRLIKHGK